METERLTLRLFSETQLNELEKMDFQSASAFCGIDSEEGVKKEIDRLKYRIVECSDGFVSWYIIEKTSGKVIGDIGLHAWVKRHDRAEIGYFLHNDFHGKGYATEAGKSVVSYGFDNLNLNRIEAHTATDNIASQHVLGKLGFKYEGLRREHYKLPSHYSDSQGYGLLRSDFNKTSS